MSFYISEWDESKYASLLPVLDADSSKYTRGSLAVVGGSARFTGAPILASLAAARAGAGYVTVMVPQDMEMVARNHLLSIPVIPAPARNGMFKVGAQATLFENLKHIDAVLVGPGMGVSPATAAVTAEILSRTQSPVILDADALNVLSGLGLDANSSKLAIEALKTRSTSGYQTILTPHDGELKRLFDACSPLASDVPEDMEGDLDGVSERVRNAAIVSLATGAIVVAKGRCTVVTTGDKALSSENATPALAKAGTGDVLAGVIGAFCAQGLKPFEAAALGVYVHSLAGVAAERSKGPLSLMAEDLLDTVPEALIELEG